jgi:hypothetical protein
LRDDNQKGGGKTKAETKAKTKQMRGFFALLRMTSKREGNMTSKRGGNMTSKRKGDRTSKRGGNGQCNRRSFDFSQDDKVFGRCVSGPSRLVGGGSVG